MSHYRVAVIQVPGSPSINDLMAPYSEHIEVSPYIYLTHDEAIARLRKTIAEMAARIDESSEVAPPTLYEHRNLDDEGLFKWALTNYWYYDESDVDGQGNIISTYNPKSKWDYYSELERLTLNEWLSTNEDCRTDDEFMKDWVELTTEGDFFKPAYYLERFGDLETYKAYCKLPPAYAVLTPDGEWHAPGTVGWFAIDDADSTTIKEWVGSFHEKFVEPYAGVPTTVTMVDCHI